MSRNLKQQRVSSYFVQSAKEIILLEGVGSVSVRKVAESAGYSFSTIYKYFSDLEALLREVKAVMIQDLFMEMQNVIPAKMDLDDIKKLNRFYASYYLERPHVFHFFYSYKLHPKETLTVNLPSFTDVWQKSYQGFVQSGRISAEMLPRISKIIIYTLHGLLALYFADYGITKDTLFIELDETADYLLKERNSL